MKGVVISTLLNTGKLMTKVSLIADQKIRNNLKITSRPKARGDSIAPTPQTKSRGLDESLVT